MSSLLLSSDMLVISNHLVYLAIAKESLAKSQRFSQRQRTELANGRALIRYDPKQRSFKNSLIAIAFSGMYLEALLHLVGSRRLGINAYEKIDGKTYEDKLRALAINDTALLADCKRFRESRRDLEHEKAFHPRSSREMRTAQLEAADAVALIERVRDLLTQKPKP